MTTIQDVARHAAVSVSTVSNVLNGRTDRMRPETRVRVEAAIDALAFRPSRLARQLKTGQTSLLGLLVPSLINPMYAYLAREIETRAQERHDHRLLIGSTHRNAAKEEDFFNDLLAHGVRRVIVISSLAQEGHLEAAVERGMAVMSYDRRALADAPSRVGHVTPDNFQAARLATTCLIGHGHRQLAFATVAGATLSRADKTAGFMAAAEAAGLAATARLLDGGLLDEYGDSVIAEVGRTIGLEIAGAANRPTGVVALNDLMAFGLMAGLREGGLQVPADVSVVGIDGTFLASLSNPGLTTVELPVRDMACTLVDEVMKTDSAPRGAPFARTFDPLRLAERDSVAAPPEASAASGSKARGRRAAASR